MYDNQRVHDFYMSVQNLISLERRWHPLIRGIVRAAFKTQGEGYIPDRPEIEDLYLHQFNNRKVSVSDLQSFVDSTVAQGAPEIVQDFKEVMICVAAVCRKVTIVGAHSDNSSEDQGSYGEDIDWGGMYDMAEDDEAFDLGVLGNDENTLADVKDQLMSMFTEINGLGIECMIDERTYAHCNKDALEEEVQEFYIRSPSVEPIPVDALWAAYLEKFGDSPRDNDLLTNLESAVAIARAEWGRIMGEHEDVGPSACGGDQAQGLHALQVEFDCAGVALNRRLRRCRGLNRRQCGAGWRRCRCRWCVHGDGRGNRQESRVLVLLGGNPLCGFFDNAHASSPVNAITAMV